MATPLVSIIIPVHNGEKFIARCIDSILAQDYKKYEIIAVVDNSEDASLGILKEYQKKCKKLKIIEKNAGSPGAARNVGLENISGELVMFVDADDALYGGAITYLQNVIEETGCDVVISGYSGEEKQPQLKKEQRNISSHDAKIEMLYQKISAAPWAKMYRAEAIGKMRFPKYSMAEDGFFNYLVFCRAEKIVIDNHLCYHYIENRAGLVLKPFSVKRMDGLKAVAEMEKIAVDAGEDEDVIEGIRCGYFFNAFSNICNLHASDVDKNDYKKEYDELCAYIKKYAPVVVKSKNATKRQKRFARSMKHSIAGTLRAMKLVRKIKG